MVRSLMDIRITDKNGKTLGFVKDSGTGKIVTNAIGHIMGRYDQHNDKTYTINGSYTGSGDQLLRFLK